MQTPLFHNERGAFRERAMLSSTMQAVSYPRIKPLGGTRRLRTEGGEAWREAEVALKELRGTPSSFAPQEPLRGAPGAGSPSGPAAPAR